MQGGMESMAVVSQVDAAGRAEVVYRRMTIDLVEDRPREISASGNPSTMVDFIERAAARHDTSASAMLRSVDDESVERVLPLRLSCMLS